MTREEAIEIIRSVPSSAIADYGFNEICEALTMAIKALKADRPRGEWERTDLEECVDGERIKWVRWNCSECGVEKKIGWTKDVNFCPNCGAKMDGERSEE